MITTESGLKCSNNDPRAIRAAAVFMQRLAETHEGRISVRSDAVYHGSLKPIDVVCNECRHEWRTTPSDLVSHEQGCPACYRQRTRDSAGTLRKPRASSALKAFANACHQAGMNYSSIGRMLNKGHKTIARWCDPEAKARTSELSRKWRIENREYYKAVKRRYRTEFEHGIAATRKYASKRRALEANAVFDIPDGERLITVDMWSLIKNDPEGQRLFISDKDAQSYADLRAEGDRLEKETGVVYEVDHLVPLSLRGSHQVENFELIPKADNRRKHNTVVHEDYALFARRIFNIQPKNNYDIDAKPN